MARKLTKKQKVLNLLSKGNPVWWKTLRGSRFDLKSPRAMIDQLRTEGHMVYINTTSTGGTTYRIGKPTKSIIAAGVDKVFYFGKDEATTNLNEIVAAGIESLYGTQKYAYSNQ
jgi:hypothetical protein